MLYNYNTDIFLKKNTMTKQSDFSKKHPLKNEWTLYYDPPKKSYINFNDYEISLKPIYTFGTVEDFWSVQNHIVKASNLAVGTCYRMFKKNIRPAWEDERNANGGSWHFLISDNSKTVDKIWDILMLCCIGEILGKFADKVTGVVFSSKRNRYKLSLWMDFATPDNRVMELGKMLKEKILEHYDEKIKTIEFIFTPFNVPITQSYGNKKNKKNKKSIIQKPILKV